MDRVHDRAAGDGFTVETEDGADDGELLARVAGTLELTGLLRRLDVSGMPAHAVPPADPTGPAVRPSA